jgi:hypothetical protein
MAGGLGDAWRPELHPRDRFGRFRSKWKLSGSAEKLVDEILSSFNPVQFKSEDEASNWLSQRVTGAHAKGTMPGKPPAEVAAYLQHSVDANAAIRAGHDSPEVSSQDKWWESSDEAMILTRVVGPEAFGLNAGNSDAIEEWTSKLVQDHAPGSTNLGTPIQAGPGDVTMYIAAPKGTKMIVPGNGREVLTSPDTTYRITHVQRNANGGHDVLAVAIPGNSKGQGRVKQLGTKLRPAPLTEEEKADVGQQAPFREVPNAPGGMPSQPSAPSSPEGGAPAAPLAAPVKKTRSPRKPKEPNPLDQPPPGEEPSKLTGKTEESAALHAWMQSRQGYPINPTPKDVQITRDGLDMQKVSDIRDAAKNLDLDLPPLKGTTKEDLVDSITHQLIGRRAGTPEKRGAERLAPETSGPSANAMHAARRREEAAQEKARAAEVGPIGAPPAGQAPSEAEIRAKAVAAHQQAAEAMKGDRPVKLLDVVKKMSDAGVSDGDINAELQRMLDSGEMRRGSADGTVIHHPLNAQAEERAQILSDLKAARKATAPEAPGTPEAPEKPVRAARKTVAKAAPTKVAPAKAAPAPVSVPEEKAPEAPSTPPAPSTPEPVKASLAQDATALRVKQNLGDNPDETKLMKGALDHEEAANHFRALARNSENRAGAPDSKKAAIAHYKAMAQLHQDEAKSLRERAAKARAAEEKASAAEEKASQAVEKTAEAPQAVEKASEKIAQDAREKANKADALEHKAAIRKEIRDRSAKNPVQLSDGSKAALERAKAASDRRLEEQRKEEEAKDEAARAKFEPWLKAAGIKESDLNELQKTGLMIVAGNTKLSKPEMIRRLRTKKGNTLLDRIADAAEMPEGMNRAPKGAPEGKAALKQIAARMEDAPKGLDENGLSHLDTSAETTFDNVPDWSPDKKAKVDRALRLYRNSTFKKINNFLRGDEKDHTIDIRETRGVERVKEDILKDHVEPIDDAMKASRTKGPVTLWRGIGRDSTSLKQLGADFDPDSGNIVGREFTDPTFVSTSADPQVGRTFGGGALMRLHVPEGVGAVQLTSWRTEERHNDEAEVLLQRGLKFRVTGDHMEQMGVSRRWVRDANGNEKQVETPHMERVLDVDVIPQTASAESGSIKKAAPSTPSRPSGENGVMLAARTRQAHIDKTRPLAELAAALNERHHETVGDPDHPRIMRNDQRVGLKDLEKEIPDLAGEKLKGVDELRAASPDELAAKAEEIAKRNGITLHGSNGDVEPFDPKRHKVLGKRPEVGSPVQVIRPGTSMDYNGEHVSLDKAVVHSLNADEVKKAADEGHKVDPKLLPKTSAPEAGPAIKVGDTVQIGNTNRGQHGRTNWEVTDIGADGKVSLKSTFRRSGMPTATRHNVDPSTLRNLSEENRTPDASIKSPAVSGKRSDQLDEIAKSADVDLKALGPKGLEGLKEDLDNPKMTRADVARGLRRHADSLENSTVIRYGGHIGRNESDDFKRENLVNLAKGKQNVAEIRKLADAVAKAKLPPHAARTEETSAPRAVEQHITALDAMTTRKEAMDYLANVKGTELTALAKHYNVSSTMEPTVAGRRRTIADATGGAVEHHVNTSGRGRDLGRSIAKGEVEKAVSAAPRVAKTAVPSKPKIVTATTPKVHDITPVGTGSTGLTGELMNHVREAKNSKSAEDVLNGATVVTLKAMAREHGIPTTARMKKPDLVAAIMAHRNGEVTPSVAQSGPSVADRVAAHLLNRIEESQPGMRAEIMNAIPEPDRKLVQDAVDRVKGVKPPVAAAQIKKVTSTPDVVPEVSIADVRGTKSIADMNKDELLDLAYDRGISNPTQYKIAQLRGLLGLPGNNEPSNNKPGNPGSAPSAPARPAGAPVTRRFNFDMSDGKDRDGRPIAEATNRANGDVPLHLPNGGADQGLVHMDSELGKLWIDMVSDPREPNSFVNEIATIGEDVGRGNLSIDEAGDRLRKLAARSGDQGVADHLNRTADELIDAPPIPKIDVPDSVPAPVRAWLEEIAKIPVFRRKNIRGYRNTGQSVIDEAQQLVREISEGRGGHERMRLVSRLKMIAQNVHESVDGVYAARKLTDRLFVGKERVVGYRDGKPITEPNPDFEVIENWLRARRL